MNNILSRFVYCELDVELQECSVGDVIEINGIRHMVVGYSNDIDISKLLFAKVVNLETGELKTIDLDFRVKLMKGVKLCIK